MAAPSYTYSFSNDTTADATQVNQNFTDILNGVSDGTKDLSISALTAAGTATFNGDVNLGNATTDTVTVTGRFDSDLDPATTATYALGDTSQTWLALYLDNGSTDGGALFFNASSTAFVKSDATAVDLDIDGFTNLDINALNLKGTGDIAPETTAAEDIGTASLAYRGLYLDNGLTDGGGVFFNAGSTAFIKSDASAGDLDIDGFTNLDINALNLKGTGDIAPETTAAEDIGTTSLAYRGLYLDNGVTDGGAVYFNSGTSSFIKSSADGATCQIHGFTSVEIGDPTGTGFKLHVKSGAANSTPFRIERDDADAYLFSVSSSSSSGQLNVYDGAGNVDARISSYQTSYFNGGSLAVGSTSTSTTLGVTGTFGVSSTGAFGGTVTTTADGGFIINGGDTDADAQLQVDSGNVYLDSSEGLVFRVNGTTNALSFAQASQTPTFTGTNFRLSTTGKGNSANPYLTPSDDTDTGFYFATNSVGCSAGGNGGWLVTSSGHTYFGTASAISSAFLSINSGANTTVGIKRSNTSGSLTIMSFLDGSDETCGSITMDATANNIAYNTSSDMRLKTSLEDFNGLDLLSQIEVGQYERLSNPGVKEVGVNAQQAHKVFPQAVTVGGDDPKVNPWMVDYSKFVGVLIKAVKELQERVMTLEAAL